MRATLSYTRLRTALPFLALLLATASCRKDLCYNHDEHSIAVKVSATATWERAWERPYDHNWSAEWPAAWGIAYADLLPPAAKGIRTVTYPATGSYIESNLSATGGRIPVPEGRSDLLFYNNDTEYLVFNDLSAVASASATTRTLTRNGFQALHARERTITQPDMLYGHYEADYVAGRTLEVVELPVEMRPLIYTYLVRYEFESGLEYIALARGALAGMAESVYLKDGRTEDDAATVLYDCTVESFGAEARVKTFGVPNYPGDHYTRADGTEARFSLNLEVRMVNGRFKTFDFDVTDQMLGQPRGGVIVVSGLKITSDEGTGGDSGFDASVDGWGDFIDIPLPLG